MSQASIRTKAPVPPTSIRMLTLTTITNPTDVNSTNYITNISPAVVAQKDGESLKDIKVLDLANEPIPVWKGEYNSDIGNAEVLTKVDVSAQSSIVVIELDDIQEVIADVGPTIIDDDAGPSVVKETGTGTADNTHKISVTNLKYGLAALDSGISFPASITSPGFDPIDNVLYPLSGRHLCIDKFGNLHMTYAKEVGGYSRVVHAWSGTGGDSWQTEYVDHGISGFHYANPTITTDSQGGLHLLYTVIGIPTTFTYLYYLGESTPAGWTLASGVGGVAYNRFILGSDYVAQELTDSHPAHPVSTLDTSGGYASTDGHHCGTEGGSNGSVSSCSRHTLALPNYDWGYSGTDRVPPYRTVKLIRYPGIPTVIPQDSLVMFASSAPAGFTRDANYDGLFLRCSDTVGATGGSLTHRHRIWGSVNGMSCVSYNGGGGWMFCSACACGHAHTYDGNITHNNDPSAWSFVLGRADSDISAIPENAIFMFDRVPDSHYWEFLSGSGSTLYNKMHKGGSSYGSAGGSDKHGTPSWTVVTTSASASGPNKGCASGIPDTTHSHNIRFVLGDQWSFPAMFDLYMARCKSTHTNIAHDIYYCYKPPGGTWTAPVNIVNSGNDYDKTGLSVLMDGNDVLHVIYDDASASVYTEATAARDYYAKIMYTYKTGSWQPSIEISSGLKRQFYPSMDIDNQNDIHTLWVNATDDKLQYRRKDHITGLWGSIEEAASMVDISEPSNLAVTDSGNVYVMFHFYYDAVNNIRDLYLAEKVNGSWQPPVQLTNLASSSYDQFLGQIYLDKDDGLTMVWSGQGYGENPDCFRIVYRYMNASGVITPPITDLADEVFTNESKHDIFPVVFWNRSPDVDNVYTNTVTNDLTFCYIKDVRDSSGTLVGDLAFNSSQFATIGQGKSVIRKNSTIIKNRGNICRTKISPARVYSKRIK